MSEYVFNGYVATQVASVYPPTGGSAALTYVVSNSSDTKSETHSFVPIIDVLPENTEQISPNALRLQIAGVDVVDKNGTLYKEIAPDTGVGIACGSVDYVSGIATISQVPSGTNAVARKACVITSGVTVVDGISFRTASSPLRTGSLIVQFKPNATAAIQTVTSNNDGTFTSTYLRGTVDFTTGIVRLNFGQFVTAAGNESQWWYDAGQVMQNGTIWKPVPVVASSIRYAAVAFSYIPLDKTILGIDPVRLPLDGRVPIFRSGDVVVLHHTGSMSVTTTIGTLRNTGRARLSRVWLYDEGNNNARVDTAKYTTDLNSGTVTLTNNTGLVGPIRIEHRIEDMALVSDVQINGLVTLSRPISHDFPVGSYLSSALVFGDLQARATIPFDQQTWTNAWDDALIGNATTAEYNNTIAPIGTSNIGTITERWAFIFINTTTVRVVGEGVGEIAQLPIAGTIAPLNPATNSPYFSIPNTGWGGGWSVGNVLRFNTIGAGAPLWIARTVAQGQGTGQSDRFSVQIRGDADNGN